MDKLKVALLLILMPTIMEAQNLDKILVWKSTYVNTSEFTTITKKQNFEAIGQITGQGLGKLLNIYYKLEINSKWEIQTFNIDFHSDTSFAISLHKNKSNQWVDNNEKVIPELIGCTDIDISLTPFTNTLPIKRLKLAIGQSKEISVIYIDLPNNKFKPVKQRYTNLGNGIYKYESLASGFTANLEVDNDGFVLNYPGIWHRVFPENEISLRQKEIFSSSLISQKINAELSDKDLYAWLIGSWSVDVIDYLENNEVLKTQGEWHFSYILEGRAVQDVWIAPKRSLRTTDTSKIRNRYGITIRYFDSSKQKWCINWFNPLSGATNKLYGWKEGEKIIHEGLDESENLMKWSFEDITSNSFHWKGEISTDKGKTFILQAEFFGTKR
ncbi:MAG: putative glycolipid-binding domain-containing protein [Chitinophagaceae bacterium]